MEPAASLLVMACVSSTCSSTARGLGQDAIMLCIIKNSLTLFTAWKRLMNKPDSFTEFHAITVRIEAFGICLPSGISFAGLSLYYLLSGNWIVVFGALPFLAAVAASLVNLYRFFLRDTNERVMATAGIAIVVIFVLQAFSPVAKWPGSWRPWMLGIWGTSIVGVHWVVLAWLNYRLPPPPKCLKRLERLVGRF